MFNKFLKENWFKIVLAVCVIAIFYFMFPKYYFIKQSDDDIIKCNKITGECKMEYKSGILPHLW